METRSFESIKSNLISMGFAFYGEPSRPSPDPEKLILEIIGFFNTDQKLFRIFLAWMDSFGDLVHVERLSSQMNELQPLSKLILGVVALKRATQVIFVLKLYLKKYSSKNQLLIYLQVFSFQDKMIFLSRNTDWMWSLSALE